MLHPHARRTGESRVATKRKIMGYPGMPAAPFWAIKMSPVVDRPEIIGSLSSFWMFVCVCGIIHCMFEAVISLSV